jgi:ligand-binding SRPBCC domain-containing protein
VRTVQVETQLAAPAAVVWERVSTIEGVNDELRPIMRMRPPARARGMRLSDVVPGQRVGRCWMFLFGFLPIDYDDLTLAAVEPGRGFQERSAMLSMRAWEHDRTIEPDGDGCRIRDRLGLEPRVPGTGALLELIVRGLFGHRHRRLRRRFG